MVEWKDDPSISSFTSITTQCVSKCGEISKTLDIVNLLLLESVD